MRLGESVESKIANSIGNHDVTLDKEFYAQHGSCFHNQHLESHEECVQLIKNSPSIIYLDHELAQFSLKRVNGPHTTFRVFGSPYSPAKGLWAFGYTPEKAFDMWEQIPLNTDILITHTPPKYHCDESHAGVPAGCEVLRQALWRIRPRLAICGHVHEGRGAERVRWDLSATNVRYKEDDVGYWIDPGARNRKQSLVDLSLKGGEPLDYSGDGEEIPSGIFSSGARPEPRGKLMSSCFSKYKERRTTALTELSAQQSEDCGGEEKSPTLQALISEETLTSTALLAPARGQGGERPSGRCDLKALTNRLGRRETCIVNAATMTRSWPHSNGGKQYNKPIVVDIDLPVWTEVS